MKGINFFNRFAFICNICFLIGFLSENMKGFQETKIFSNFILILALIAFLVNTLSLIITAFGFLSKKRVAISKVLVILNFAFFLLQFYHFFKN